MTPPGKISNAWQIRPAGFHILFIGGMCTSLWFAFGPSSGIHWDNVSEAGLAMAVVQLLVYALRYFAKSARWEPPVAWEVAFFIFNLTICLVQLHFHLHYYQWIVQVFIGLMIVILPKRISLAIAAIVVLLYVPVQTPWSKLTQVTFGEWFDECYGLAFPIVLGLVYRQLMDRNEERAKLIEELLAAKSTLEQARDREGELATLRERERLARDFHDTLGHQLVTLTVQLEAAHRLLAVDPARAAALIADMQKLSRASMDELRRSLDNLRTSGLGGQPLGTALQNLCRETGQRLSLAVQCDLAEGIDALPPLLGEVLWRIAQEGLTNAGQHAEARHIQVVLNILPKEVIMKVIDDGLGISSGAEDKPGHYGLRGLRERAEGLGGALKLATVVGGGTVLEARLPIIS